MQYICEAIYFIYGYCDSALSYTFLSINCKLDLPLLFIFKESAWVRYNDNKVLSFVYCHGHNHDCSSFQENNILKKVNKLIFAKMHVSGINRIKRYGRHSFIWIFSLLNKIFYFVLKNDSILFEYKMHARIGHDLNVYSVEL
jgi:hypothetical protein